MPRTATLTLVVPHLFARVRDRPVASSLSALAMLAGRGDLERKWHADSFAHARLKPWQRGLLQALALEARDHPSASLSALGAGISESEQGAQDWMHAEPIHLA